MNRACPNAPPSRELPGRRRETSTVSQRVRYPLRQNFLEKTLLNRRRGTVCNNLALSKSSM